MLHPGSVVSERYCATKIIMAKGKRLNKQLALSKNALKKKGPNSKNTLKKKCPKKNILQKNALNKIS